MVEKLFCPRCRDDFNTAEGLVTHIKLLHPEFRGCLHNTSLGAIYYASIQYD
ncbi:hypothetical protein GX563_11525 [Candidatus Bathyarchaeota archaeon]|nr:hypothetical protein [Candidatus Bathyarchaeota archaeon]